MQRYIPPEAERYGKRNHRRSIWKKIVSGLACVVVFCTTYALILPAITQERETYCGQEAHKHDESCYTQTSTAKTMVCTPETPCVHTHSELCYDAAGTLVCQLPEVSQHEHTDSCYAPAETAVPVLHTHSDVCYTQEQGELQCQLEESEEHTHTADCYTWNSVLTCGMEEGEVEPTTAAEPVLICTEPVLAVHEHTESCFETATEDTLSCGKEEHEHDLSCYSNPEADLETAEDWEAAFQDVELSGVWTQDVLAIAKTQLGYTESTSNYTVNEDGTTNGYTRYGAWYGKPYDDWCAMFVSFCLDYAGVEDMPLNANCEKWIEALAAKDCGLYQAAGTHEPQSGELIFFDNNGDGISDHVGLVAEIIEATDTEPAQIRTIEGNSSNRVQYVTYELDDAAILGYASLPSQLTEEEQATVDYVISLIDAVPSADEIDAKMVQFEDAEDYEGEEAWLTEVYQQVYDAYYRYNRLSDTQKDYVTNADKLLELQFIWDRMTYALTNELSIYQINAYYPENGYDASCYAAMLIWGGSFDSQVQLSWMMDMPFNYWDAVVVDKDADGNYYIKQYDVSTNDKSTLVAPDNGFVLIYTTDKTHSFWLSDLDIKVGDYVTISSTIQNFNYKNYSGDYDEDNTTNGQYNGSAYCTITFSSEKSDSSTTVTGTNDVDVVKAVSTKDFIELNLYDYYGSASASANGKLDINTKWDTTPNASDGTIQKDSTKKEYLGFQWNGGAYAYLRTPSTSTVPNGTKLVDRNVVDNIDFGNSVITDYEFKAGDYGSPSATSQKAAYGNSEGWGRINRIEVDQYGWGITCRPIGMSTLKDRTSGTIYNEVLERTLNADGYPQLAALDYEEGQGSLEYLFSENDYAKKVNSGTIDGLFQYDETTGMYSYNSRQNHAQYNAETETFTLYKQIITPNFILYPFGNFLPFNDITDSATSTLVGGDNDTAGAGSAYIERIMNRLRSSDNFSNYTYTTYNYTTEEQLYNMLEEYKNNWGSYDYNGVYWANAKTSTFMNDFFNTAASAGEAPSTVTVDFSTLKAEDGTTLIDKMYNIDYDVEKNFFFGMEMKMNFYQPRNGLTGKDTNGDGAFDYPMVFYFTGDDDVWVYIDNVLFLDLSGIHRHVGGKIDFQKGRVYYYYVDVDSGGDVIEENYNSDGTIATRGSLYQPYGSATDADGNQMYYYTFEELLEAAGKDPADYLKMENGSYTTFKDYSTHSFKFYYMERGSGSSICRLNFNFPLVQQNTITIQKEVESSDQDEVEIDSVLGDREYTFQILDADTNEPFLAINDPDDDGKWVYSLYDTDGTAIQEVHVVSKNPDGTINTLEVYQGNNLVMREINDVATYYNGRNDDGTPKGVEYSDHVLTTTADSKVTLKAGQRVEIIGVAEKWGEYYIKEILPEGYEEQYEKVTVTGETSSKEYTLSSPDIGKGLASNNENANASNTFTFTNTVDVDKLGALTISKTVSAYTAQDADKEFMFNVTLDGEPLPVGTSYGTDKTVETAGVIKLKAGETATISNIIAGTQFEVTETSESSEGFIVQYKVDDTTQSGSATGTIGLNNTVKLEVTNSEKGAKVSFPVTKQYSLYGSTERTTYFNFVQVTDNTGKTTVGDAVSASITVSSEAVTESELFSKTYLPENITFGDDGTAKFYYRLTEDNTQLPGYTAKNYQVYVYEVTVTKTTDNLKAEITGIWSGTADEDGNPTGELTKLESITTPSFTNTITRNLVINKTVSGASDTTTEFEFTLELSEGNSNAPVPTTLTGYLNGSTTGTEYTAVDGVFTFKLKNGDSLKLTGLPYKCKLVLKEKTAEGYIPSFQVFKDSDTTVQAKGTDEYTKSSVTWATTTVKYTNTYTYELPETGGAGAGMYTMTGLTLILFSAAYLLYRFRKRRREGV